MTTSVDLQGQAGGQIGSEERPTGDTSGPNKPGHSTSAHGTNGNGNGSALTAPPAAPPREWTLNDSVRQS